jgi:two-component system, LytTR family, response regulator
VADVDWIEAARNYVRLHIGKTVLMTRDSLTTLETRLDPRRFVRIHRSAIVNLDRVRELQPWFSGDYVVILTTGEKLRLSRSYRRAFESRFGHGLDPS